MLDLAMDIPMLLDTTTLARGLLMPSPRPRLMPPFSMVPRIWWIWPWLCWICWICPLLLWLCWICWICPSWSDAEPEAKADAALL